MLKHWNVWVGRQPCEGFELRAGDISVRAEDVRMWAEKTLVGQTIGEVSVIAHVAGLDVYAQPKDEPSMPLTRLPELLQSMGLSFWRDGGDYLENSYLAYELEPVEDPEADWAAGYLYWNQPTPGAYQRLLAKGQGNFSNFSLVFYLDTEYSRFPILQAQIVHS